jgi:hypothetical protein
VKLQKHTKVNLKRKVKVCYRMIVTHILPPSIQQTTWSIGDYEEEPTYITVYFQTNREDNLNAFQFLFDENSITSVYLQLNFGRYLITEFLPIKGLSHSPRMGFIQSDYLLFTCYTIT